jgi:methylmalonyl-CoA/ethylmalonyl-CoA epimerase
MTVARIAPSLSNTIGGVVAPRGIHHVGVAVDDLDGALATYERLFGATLEHREQVEDQGVEAASLRVGSSRIELLAPLAEDTPVGRFLAKRGPGVHHVAFETADVGAELARLKADGVELVDETPRPGLFGLQVGFVHPEATGGVLAEFVGNE